MMSLDSLITICVLSTMLFSRVISFNVHTLSTTYKTTKFTKLYLTTHIHIVGKKSGGEQFIADGIEEYEKRLSTSLNIQNYFYKTDDELVAAVNQAKYKIICLDENGTEYTSRQFSKVVFDMFLESGANIGFVIGGFSGLPKVLKEKHKLISLSKMTWTHQMARLLLVEQIYRANEIHKGSKYHKD